MSIENVERSEDFLPLHRKGWRMSRRSVGSGRTLFRGILCAMNLHTEKVKIMTFWTYKVDACIPCLTFEEQAACPWWGVYANLTFSLSEIKNLIS
jgi:hypothetical protein